MVKGLFQKLTDFIVHNLLNPGKIFLLCLVVLGAALLLDGSLFRLWRLHRDSKELEVRIEQLKSESFELANKIKRTEDPHFIELQAREKFDMAQEGDLIFVFAEED